MAIKEEEMREVMDVWAEFRNLKTFFAGGEKVLKELLENKLTKIIDEEGEFINENNAKHTFLNICYFSAENDQLVVGYYRCTYKKSNARAGLVEIITELIPLSRVEKDFHNDPEKVKKGIIIPIMVDLDWTLTKFHSYSEKGKLQTECNINLEELNTKYINAIDKGAFVQDRVEEQIANKAKLLNLAEEFARVFQALKEAGFHLALTTNCREFVWIELIIGLLRTCSPLNNFKHWRDIFDTCEHGYGVKADFIENALNTILKQPGIIGYRLVCLIDDDQDNITSAERYGLKKGFTAELDKKNFLIELCDFFEQDAIKKELTSNLKSDSNSFAMQVSPPPVRHKSSSLNFEDKSASLEEHETDFVQNAKFC